MNAADSIRQFLIPLLPGWRIQFGRWIDGAATDRFAVLRPTGGIPASLVREPQFTLLLIGARGAEMSEAEDAAEAVIEAMRNAGPGDRHGLVSLQAGEPVYTATDDGRPVFETAVSAITT